MFPFEVPADMLTKQGSATLEKAITSSEAWGAEHGTNASRQDGSRNLDEINASWALELSKQVGSAGPKLTMQFGYKKELETSRIETNGHDDRQTYSRQLEELKSQSTMTGTEISGGKLVAAITLTNTSKTLGISLTNVTYNLYGLRIADGRWVETLISTLPADLGNQSLSLSPLEGKTFQLTDASITTQQLEDFSKYQSFMITLSGNNAGYNPTHTQPMQLSDVMTNVNARSARVEIHFEPTYEGQESPYIRYPAVSTKWLEELKSYAPTYLGELLLNMGLTYEASPNRKMTFKKIQKNEVDASHFWQVMLIRQGSGGSNADTVIVDRSGSGRPDSLIVKPGDLINITYSGDSDTDGVADNIERMFGTFSKIARDFDGDGLTDSAEIFGWNQPKISGDQSKLYTNPASVDSDGDGEKDNVDLFPLKPSIKSNSSLIELWYAKGSGPEAKIALDTLFESTMPDFTLSQPQYKYTRSKALDLGTTIHFKLVFAGLPKNVELLVDGVKRTDLVRDASDLDQVIYKTKGIIGIDSTYRVGAKSKITIRITPLDGSTDTTYILYNQSEVGTTDTSITSVTLDPRKPWKAVRAKVNILSQLAVEPRTSGILVIRHNDNLPAAPLERLAPSSVIPSLGPLLDNPGYQVVAIVGPEVLNSEEYNNEYQVVDSLDIKAGTQYSYSTIAFSQSGIDYYFGSNSKTKKPITTKSIYIQAGIDTLKCHKSHDGTDMAEIKSRFTLSRKHLNQTWETLYNKEDQQDADDGWILNFKPDTTIFDWQEDDSIDVYILVTETDGPGNGDDDNWNTSFVKLSVRQLLELTSIDQPAANGWIFSRFNDPYKSSSTLTLPTLPYPTEANKSIINWNGNEWNGNNSTADADMMMWFNLSWYIK